MTQQNDWRLTGQEQYLLGKTLRRAQWSTNKETWDHDHCAFCWEKFTTQSSENAPNVELSGYVTEDGRHWICGDCFRDFREQFRWQVSDDPLHNLGSTP
jgi:hypothetical protein